MRIKEKEFLMATARNVMKLQDVATEAGVSRATLSCVKNGRRCSPVLAGKIAKALDVDVGEIFDLN